MKIELEQVLPSQIEARSFEIIGRELEEMGKRLDPEQEPVIKRCIHTTADFEYADSLAFSGRAVALGLEALRAGAHIVTDTRMGWSGVNKARLAKLGGEVLCFMAVEDVARTAAERGTTRAAASMDKVAALYGQGGPREAVPCIFAVGNAPTALVRLYELVTDGLLKPALIIGVPVGFVNVVQSKELILTLEHTPYIVARGRKGGSNVAAAICNALLYRA
ncbi:MAG: precorrin-8X methylmutase [Clostridium sp.]|nr:precorrin-8X methylmutase [Clostridium sp.]